MGINVSIHPRTETTAEVQRSGNTVWLKIQNGEYGGCTEVTIFLNFGIATKIRDALALAAVSESADI